ncbi:ISAs1 family transposase, partial [Micromonospora fulviviridis]
PANPPPTSPEHNPSNQKNSKDQPLHHFQGLDLADWLCSRLPVAPPAAGRVIAVDGKVVRGAVLPEGRVHLLSAYDTSTGVVLAQVQVAAKSNEIPAFAPLLEQVAARLGGLAGVVIVADVLHTQVAHARTVAAAGGHLYVSVKANQPTLFAQLKRLPWADVTAVVRPVPSRR